MVQPFAQGSGTPSRVHAQFLHLDPNGVITRPEVRVRTDFALRFGDIRTEERQISQDVVRTMFNSPFRPFVLASTSVGQEGLDFHPWCHRLLHASPAGMWRDRGGGWGHPRDL
jgi:hypothetical protein